MENKEEIQKTLNEMTNAQKDAFVFRLIESNLRMQNLLVEIRQQLDKERESEQ